MHISGERIHMNSPKNLFLSVLRNKKTTRPIFRTTAEQLSNILALEALHQLPTATTSLETPLAPTSGTTLQCDIMLIPILRSGITMLPTFLHYLPEASIGVIGVRRDETTAEPYLYYKNLPPFTNNTYVIILDPMIATGGTGKMALSMLADLGIPQEHILFCSIICAPEGIERLKQHFPRVTYITTAIDKELNPHKFIVPGIGDFGDRYFGTER